ncbi:MAG: hypothetical protein J3Q66DRAFT_9595 [Benniella sp.]|nr:MAG: hypothetical protein J3Q66DRAFT_9595 [Benniella sp.]
MQRSAAPSQARKRALGTAVAGAGGRLSQNESSQPNESASLNSSSSRLHKPFKPPSIVAAKHIQFKSPLNPRPAAHGPGPGLTVSTSISLTTPVNVTTGSNKRASDATTPDARKHLKLANSSLHRLPQTSSAFKPPQPRHNPDAPGANLLPRPPSAHPRVKNGYGSKRPPGDAGLVDVVVDPLLGQHL